MCYGWRIVPVLLVFGARLSVAITLSAAGLGAIMLALWLSQFSRVDRPT